MSAGFFGAGAAETAGTGLGEGAGAGAGVGAGEGHSFSDMKRWRLLETLNNRKEKDITGKLRYTRAVTSRDYLWPIPADEIEKNPKLLPNNPGW